MLEDKISQKLELNITGNPFIDSGIFALACILNKNISDITINDLKLESEKISKIYTKLEWKRNIYSIFPNNILVNPASTNKPNLQELYFENLMLLLDNIEPIQDKGSCMGCGRRNAKRVFGKDSIPLTGSKSLINYFSFADKGADYCSLCAILINFIPLVLYSCGGKMILLHSNSSKVMNFWSKNAINNIHVQISSGAFSGCYNQGINRPTNAIFEIISQVIKSNKYWRGENPSLNFYYFTNYNKGPELDIFTLPTNVFNFLTEIPMEDRNNWNFIVKKAYSYVKWQSVENEGDYKNNPNRVYDNLLVDKSILKLFFSVKFKKVYCSWKLVKSYMKRVKSMDEKRIDVIRDVGDRLSVYIKNNDSLKTLNKLEQASNYNNFRNILRKILKNNIHDKNNELLFIFDDYVNYLFPDGNMTWRETQDLLLFRIYENLHKWLIDNKYVEELSKDELLEED